MENGSCWKAPGLEEVGVWMWVKIEAEQDYEQERRIINK